MSIKIQIGSPHEYEGRVLIEMDAGYDDCDHFIVPAWEERGLSELAGPFDTVEAAYAVMTENREYLEYRGYTFS